MTLAVLHADDRILVLDKPSGLLSVPGRGREKADCLAARAAAAYPGARIVHRLDQPTSGVMVLALDAEAHRHLGRQFERRRVAKTYRAVVAGAVRAEHGAIVLPLRTDWPNRPRQIVDPVHGRPALTCFETLDRGDDRTALRLRPVTGRSHQLRVHLATIGHPILGDDLYAPPDVVAMASRLLLHAERLAFAHPVTGEQVAFEGPPPF